MAENTSESLFLNKRVIQKQKIKELGHVHPTTPGWYVRTTPQGHKIYSHFLDANAVHHPYEPAVISFDEKGQLKSERYFFRGREMTKEAWQQNVAGELNDILESIREIKGLGLQLKGIGADQTLASKAQSFASGIPVDLTGAERAILADAAQISAEKAITQITQALMMNRPHDFVPSKSEPVGTEEPKGYSKALVTELYATAQQKEKSNGHSTPDLVPTTMSLGDYAKMIEKEKKALENSPAYMVKEEVKKSEPPKENKRMGIDLKAEMRQALLRGTIRKIREMLVSAVADLLSKDLSNKESGRATVVEILRSPYGGALFSIALGSAIPLVSQQLPEEYAKYVDEAARELRISGGEDVVFELSGLAVTFASGMASEIKNSLEQLKAFDEKQDEEKRRVELGPGATDQKHTHDHEHDAVRAPAAQRRGS